MTSLVQQRTLRNEIQANGIGLHTGAMSSIRLRPAPPDTGIVFRRTDLCPTVSIQATVRNIVDGQLATTLGCGDVRISTVEHLMSALSGMDVDNAYVDVSAPEIPIMDGSAAVFVFLIQSAGTVQQDAPRRFVKINKEITFQSDDGVWVSFNPHNGFRIEYTLQYDHPVFESHASFASVEVSPATYVTEVSRARTFGFLADVERLRALNLARGGSLENVVVLDDDRIINEEQLRQEDEFVKHKILDAIGDLYLLGYPLLASYQGFKSGHSTNHRILNSLLDNDHQWDLVTLSEDGQRVHSSEARPTVA